MFDEFAWWVALGVANLVNLLDPEIVVIGGGLVEAGDVLLDPVRGAYRELVLAADHRPTSRSSQAALGEQARGAASPRRPAWPWHVRVERQNAAPG